ncbi:MAG: APC family permease, partial [Candidatus Aminicenantes bacterium]
MNKEEKTYLTKRKALARAMTFKNYVGLGLGSIIGVGWVVVAGDWLIRGGPLGAILGFVLGGLLLAVIGLSYAELTPAIPVAGGEVAFAFKAFGPGPSFLTGWLLSFAYIALCPFEAVAIGWLIEYIIPGLKSKSLYTVGGYPVSLISITTGVILSLFIIVLNYRGVKNSARFQTVATSLIFVCVAAFTLIALVKGSFSNMMPLFAGEGTGIAVFGSIIAILGIVPFFYSGFDIIPQGAEESRKKLNPKDLGKAVIVSIIVAAVFYGVVILALSVCMPWQETVKFEMPTATAFQVAFGYAWATRLVLLAAFFGLITSFNGFFIAATRVLFATGRGGLLPEWLGDINEKYRTPKNAILFVGMLTLIGPFIGRSSLLPIVNVASLAFISGWFITCLSTIMLRKTAPDMKRPYKAKNKISLYLGAVIAGIIIILMIFPGSSAQLTWPLEYIILGVWIFLGYVGYRWRKAKKD